MEWTAETEIFLIVVYVVIPTLLIGGLLSAMIWFIKELLKSKDKGKE